MLKFLYSILIDSTRKIRSYKLRKAIKSLPFDGKITYIDIGSAGGIEPRWKLVDECLNYIGFEPDARSRNIIINSPNSKNTNNIYPFAIGDGSDISLNLCRMPTVSSTFLPNQDLLSLYPSPDRFDIIKTISVPSKTLDDLSINRPNFIKLDIQGGELKALIGAKSTLTYTLGVEIEIEFINIYTEQPLFGDLNNFLTSRDFIFIDFLSLSRWERKKIDGFGQCVFGDALYLKTPELIRNLLFKTDENLDLICTYLSILIIYERYDIIDKTFDLIPHIHHSKFSIFLLFSKIV
jgi:FkbM family methyltransferase